MKNATLTLGLRPYEIVIENKSIRIRRMRPFYSVIHKLYRSYEYYSPSLTIKFLVIGGPKLKPEKNN